MSSRGEMKMSLSEMICPVSFCPERHPISLLRHIQIRSIHTVSDIYRNSHSHV